MKHAHIGLVALAAVLVAGCGGGSDNGGGGSFAEDVTGLGGNAERSALAGKVGETYEVPAGKPLTVDVPDGQVTFRGCKDGCMVRVSSDNGKVVVMSTAKGVSGDFVAKPAPRQPQSPNTQQPPGTVTAEKNEQDKDASRAEGKAEGIQEGVNQGLAQAEVEDRAEELLRKLSGIGMSSGEAAVTVEHMRGESRTVKPIAAYSSGPTAPSIPGFTGAGFSRTTADFEDTLYLYTNIGSPNTRPFWKVHGTDDLGELEESDGEVKHSGSSIQIMGTSADPYREDGKRITTTDTAEGVRIRATYGGTSGWLVRDGHTMKVAFPGRKLPEGEPIGNWEFRAASLTAFHQRPQDETYLYFGIWAREPKDKDGTPDFKWIAGGGLQGLGQSSVSIMQENFDALTGTAKFVGGAVGQYAIDKTATGGSADVGTFTATATFDAAFDVEGNANDRKLSGSITGFRKMEDGSALAGTLYLGGAGGNPPATLAYGGVAPVAGASGEIDGVKVTGNWAANLYGVDNEAAPEGVTCPNGCAADVAGITGWFTADENSSGNGSVVAISGAFGAAKQ